MLTNFIFVIFILIAFIIISLSECLVIFKILVRCFFDILIMLFVKMGIAFTIRYGMKHFLGAPREVWLPLNINSLDDEY